MGKRNNFEFFSLDFLFFEIRKIDKKIKLAFHKDLPFPGRLTMLSNKLATSDNYIHYYMGGYLFEALYIAFLSLCLILRGKYIYLISIMTYYLIRYIYFSTRKEELLSLTDFTYIKMFKDRKEALKSDGNYALLQLVSGRRPRDLDFKRDDFKKDIFKYYYYLDKKEYKKLSSYLKDLYIGSFGENMVNKLAIYYELIFYYSFIEKDKFKAYKYYKEVEKELEQDLDVNSLRIRAYYEYYIQIDEKKALKFIEKAIEMAPSYPIKGLSIMELDLIEELKEKIQKNKHKNRIYL